MGPMRDLAVPQADLDVLRAASPRVPRVAIVAGSGLGGLSALVSESVTVPYSDLMGWPQTSALAGHAGRLVLGVVGETPVMVFDGRAHLYQGLSAAEVAYPARLSAGVGVRTLLLTNAAGGISPDLRTGDVVLIADHLNLTGTSPLVGWTGPEGGVPFVPMGDAWDFGLRELAKREADSLGFVLREGVYAGLLGPAYETPAEVRMLRGLGADVVGMSTVTEAIAARALGLRLLGFSLVTNVAGEAGLSHEEVLAAGKAAERHLSALVVAILHRLSAV
jgi:purine-nucleoside phosphorylase